MDIGRLRADYTKVEAVLAATPSIDATRAIELPEYRDRQRKVWDALEGAGFDAGFVFSDEHYAGDVPYLSGNTNITIEQVAGVIGPNGFHVIAGLEGGYVVEQLAVRSGSQVHKVEMLKLADEDYPVAAESPEEVFEQACGKTPRRIGLLSPREVVPVKIIEFLQGAFGAQSLVDAQELYSRIKYEKSEAELALTRDASVIGDAMVRAMLAVLRPGTLETEIASWGHFVGRQLGAEEMGWDIMVTANTANRTLIGKALNRPIGGGDMVHLGVAPKRDGLNSCVRRSVVAVEPDDQVPAEHRYWLEMVKEAYEVGYAQFVVTARDNLPACTIERAVLDFLASKSEEVSRRVGRPVDLPAQKPYTCVHNGGYTECQEFYGAVTLARKDPLGERIVNMLDVALRGCGSRWDEIVIPGLDYVVVENTLGKSGRDVECLSSLPADCQRLVGNAEMPG